MAVVLVVVASAFVFDVILPQPDFCFGLLWFCFGFGLPFAIVVVLVVVGWALVCTGFASALACLLPWLWWWVGGAGCGGPDFCHVFRRFQKIHCHSH